MTVCILANSADEAESDFLLATDFGLVSVKPSPFTPDQRYRFIETVLITHRVGDLTKDLGYRTQATYAVDCEASPRRIAEIVFAVNSRPYEDKSNWVYLKPIPDSVTPKNLPFQSLSAAQEDFSQRLSQQRIAFWNNNLPSMTSAISEYVCRKKQGGEDPRTVGVKINARGGFDDLKVLSCTVHLPRSGEQVEWTVGFSEKGSALKFGYMWQSTAAVTENDLGFTLVAGDGPPMVIRISRSTGSLTAVATQNGYISSASGVCVVAADRPKKF